MTLFESPAVKNQLQKAIPSHLTVDRLLRVAMTSIRTNPKLLECTQESLLACVMGCAALGLEPEPFLGQAYLVPYFNKKKGCFEAQLIPGYRGYISLARRSGELQSLSAQCVYENDYFKLGFGLHEVLDHEPADGDRGEFKGAYVIFRYKDGSHSFDYMPKSDIDKIRSRSKSGDFGPWVTDYPEMAKKTVIRRHIKVAPLSVELSRAAVAENLSLSGESQIDFFTGNEESKTELIDGGIDELHGPTFDDLVEASADRIDTKSLEAFVYKTATANDCSEDEVKAGAEQDFNAFLDAFNLWDAAQKKKLANINEQFKNSGSNARPPENWKEPLPEPEEKPEEKQDSRTLSHERFDLKKLKAHDAAIFKTAVDNLTQKGTITTAAIDKMTMDEIDAVRAEVEYQATGQ